MSEGDIVLNVLESFEEATKNDFGAISKPGKNRFEKYAKPFKEDLEKLAKPYHEDIEKFAETYHDDLEKICKPYKEDLEKPCETYEEDLGKVTQPYEECEKTSKSYSEEYEPEEKPYKETYETVVTPYGARVPDFERLGLYPRSSNGELERLERALNEVKTRKVEKEFCKDKFTETLINNLYSQINHLKDEVVYLRNFKANKDLHDSRMRLVDDHGTGCIPSNIQSPTAPSTIATYMSGTGGKLNPMNASQQLDGDLGEDCGDLLMTATNKLNNQFSNNYIPLGISNQMNNDASSDTDNVFVPRPLTKNMKELKDHASLLGSSDELYDNPLKDNPLLSDDEIPEPHPHFTSDGAPRMNERWQTAVIFMIVMSFLILVCCLIPIILIPR